MTCAHLPLLQGKRGRNTNFRGLLNPEFIHYDRYGGRGIKVCDKWKNSFITFYKDMGPRPFPKAQLDRINNDKGYSKDNCRWVTPAENSRNRSSTVMTKENVIEMRKLYKSGKYTQKDLCRKYGINSLQPILKNKTWKGVE